MDSTAQMQRLRSLYPDAEPWTDGGQALAYLPRLTLLRGATKHVVAALLCPHARDGYPTRLYLDRQIEAPNANNWRACTVCGETWWACSWNYVPATLPWPEVLANHLRAFQ